MLTTEVGQISEDLDTFTRAAPTIPWAALTGAAAPLAFLRPAPTIAQTESSDKAVLSPDPPC